MRLFAISDLHLPGGDDKPMDVFGFHWEHHFEKIAEDWISRVSEEDVVLIPGDISWAMQTENAKEDIQAISLLPGRKILLRGNHDYWWNSITRVRAMLPNGMYAVQNDAVRLGEYVFCGSRGWTGEETAADRKIFNRELMRLKMSLDNALRLGGNIIVMCHYPPVTDTGELNGAGEVLSAYPVSAVVYGHIHGTETPVFNGFVCGMPVNCVSCDKLGFRLFEIIQNGNKVDHM